MKKLISFLALFCAISICSAQIPTPIPGAYLNPTSANLCTLNPGFGISALNLIPIGSPAAFTLSLQVYVVTATTPLIPPYPQNWPPYPDCNTSVVGNHPILLENCTISNCNLGQQPTFISTTNTFDWQIDNCAGQANIGEIRYSIYLDCSLYSLLGPPNNALYLVQKWFYQDLSGILTPLPIQPQVIPIMYPNFSFPNLVQLPANYNTTSSEEWIFPYQNIGTADASVVFDFHVDPCTEYTLGIKEYSIGATPGAGGWTSFSTTQPENVPMQDFLFIKQHVSIGGCATDCGPLAFPVQIDPKKAHFSWRCDRPLPNSQCVKCYREEYITELDFQFEQPTFTVTRSEPVATTALHNTTCQSTTPWKIKIQNTSQHTEIPQIVVNLANIYPTSFSLIDNNSISIIPAGTTGTSCSSCTYTKYPAPEYLVPPIEVSLCAQTLTAPVSSFYITVSDLKPGEFVTFQFEEFHCCSENELLFGQNKYFNQWQINAEGTTVCNSIIYPDVNVADNALINLSSIPGTGGISGYSSTTSTDLNLNLSFSNTNGHTVVPKETPPQAPPYYALGPLDYEIDINGLFGDVNDQQALGYSSFLSQNISGIFKVEIDIKDAGLLLTNPAHAYFEVYDVNGNVLQWHSFDYHNLACDPSAYSGTSAPCTTNASGDIECAAATYCLYFRISDLVLLGFPDPSVVFNTNLNANSNQTKFKFSLYPCCTSSPQTHFEVLFSLMHNESCDVFATDPSEGCDPIPCFIPLSSVGSYTTVHCPGCLAPGAIVDDYRMERSTLGFPDVANDRYADNFTAIEYKTGLNNTSPAYLQFDELKLDRSVYGDSITDYTIAHFEDGYYNMPTYPGYTYQMMKNSPFNIVLDHLQLFRTFPFSGNADFNVQVTGFEFYIDDPNSTFPTCINGNDFYTSVNNIQHPTDFYMSINFDQASPATVAKFFELGTAADDDKMLFTFSISDLNDLINNPLPAGVYAAAGLISPISYEVWQVYRLRVRYKVCGNFHDPAVVGSYDHWKKETDVTSYMYLTGSAKVISDFLPGLNPMASALVMPSDLPGLSALGITIVPSDPCLNNPPTCVIASDANLGDPYCFICEPSGGFHTFYSTDMINKTGYKTNYLNPEFCEYSMEINAINSHQRLTDGANLTLSQLFPYEFKPANLFPSVFNVSPPVGWKFAPNAAGVIEVKFSTKLPGANTFTTPVTFNYTGSPTNFNIDIDNPQYGFNFYCMGQNPAQPLLIGDEYSHLRFEILTKPIDPVNSCVTQGSPYADSTQSVISFISNDHDCSLYELDCALVGEQNNNPLPFPRFFVANNPNLSGNIVPAGLNATSQTLEWDFSFTNTSIGSGASATTPVKNIYIAIPNATYLTDWELDYTISGNYPVWNSPIVTASTVGLTPDSHGYFWLLPDASFDYLPANATITQGKIRTHYDVCTAPAEVEFVWGWNCMKETNNAIGDVDLCLEVPSDPLNIIENEEAVLSYHETISSIPPSYIACDINTTTVQACFQNASQGDLIPISFSLINNGNLDIIGNPAITTCTGNLLSTQYTSTINGSGINMITVSQSGSIPDKNYMQSGDCFCITFEIQPLCNFGELQLPTVAVNWENYCGDTWTTNYPLPSIPPNQGTPTLCTDCYMISKTALNTSAIASGTEPVTFEIVVSGNNAPGVQSPEMYVWDNFPVLPSVFSSIGYNPFGAGGSSNAYQMQVGDITGIGTLSLSVTGTITTPIQSPNPLVCNEAVLGDISLTQIAIDDACVEILPSCTDPTLVEFVIEPLPGQTSILLSTLLSINPNLFSNFSIFDVIGTLIIDQDVHFVNEFIYFEPMAEIFVNAGRMITFSSCTLQACTKMWKGIILDTDVILSTRHSEIRGAQYGIKVSNNDNITINATDFVSNYIGIYVPNIAAPPQTFNGSSIWVADSRFIGSGNLPLPYQGQTNYLGQLPATGDIPYAGILAYRTFQLFLGQDANYFGPNEFFNMSNGIVGQRSQLLKLQNCKFNDIQPDPWYNTSSITAFGTNFNGSAIYGNGHKTSWEIEQAGFGTSVNDIPTFVNCRYGIFADRISLNSSNNKMEAMGTGYRAQLVKTGVKIYENIIDASQDGVQLLHCDNGNVTNEIRDNNITFGDYSMTASYAGVNVQESKIPNFYSRVHNNDIFFRPNSLSARFGIIALSTQSFEITENSISQADNNQQWDGIHLDDCFQGHVSCNNISATGLLPTAKTDQSAIKYTMGDGPTIACNWMNNTPNGLFIIGQILVTHNLVVKGNEFNEHFLALRYGTNTIGVAQEKLGNTWPVKPPGVIQAINENPFLNAQSDFYEVHLSNPPLPLGITYFPGFDPPNSSWFKTTGSGQNENCEDPPGPETYCNTNFPENAIVISELDRLIAEDSIVNDPYTIETLWLLKKSLYSKLNDDPGLLTDSLMAEFYLSVQNTILAELKLIDNGKEGLFSIDTSIIAQLDQYKILSDSVFSLISDNMELMKLLIDNGSNIQSSLAVINAYQQILEAYYAMMDSLKSPSDAQRIFNSETLKVDNSQLTTSLTIEDNEKIVNDIYFSTIGKDIVVFTTTQLNILRYVAGQCPLSGGGAVIKARALLFFADEKLYYNDRDICGQQGIELKQMEKAINHNPLVIIHPNPANEQVTIDYEFPESKKLRLEIYSVTGKVIMIKELLGGKNSKILNTSDYAPGIYYLALIDDNGISYNKKLAVIR